VVSLEPEQLELGQLQQHVLVQFPALVQVLELALV
jgi:hypothetical protein